MNGPYYRNHSRSRSVPVHKPKVISIPVHFISSDHHHQQPQTITNKHSSSALKIQKVFKGHTVRKALNKIVSIKNQVNEIEERLQNDVGFVRMLRDDAKERLRVNETLMSLLFQLDSVRGVENGVREVRKSVAKKAVALQEKVDSIAQSFEEDDDDISNSFGDKVKEDVVGDDVSNVEKTELCDLSNGVVDDDDISNINRDQELVVHNSMNEDSSMKGCDDDVNRHNVDSTDRIIEDYVDDVSNDDKTELCDVGNSIPNKVDEEYVKDVVVDDDVRNNVGNLESVDNRESVMKKCDADVSRSCCDHEMAVNEDLNCGDDDVSKGCCYKGMVEKLVSDNAKMMRLIIQISERNEMQTRMINALSKRVELLEKAFIMSDKWRRRKKSHTRREKDSFCI